MPEYKDEWEELIRSDLQSFNTSIPMHSITYSNNFISGPKYQKILFFVKDKVGYYYENFKDHHIVGDYCLKLFLEDKNKYKEFIDFWNKDFKRFNEVVKKIRDLDLNGVESKELANLLKELYQVAIEWHGTAYNVDAIDTVLTPLIEETIKKTYPEEKKSKLSAIYNKLTIPKEMSYVNRMELDKLMLLKEIKEKGIEECKEKINKLIENYYWVNFGWGEAPEYTKEDLLKELEKADINAMIEQIQKRFDNSMNEKDALVDEIAKVDPLIKDYINIFDDYAVFHDWRKEGQVKAVHYIREMYKIFAERFDIDIELLYCMFPVELAEQVLKDKKPEVESLRKRTDEWYYEYTEDGTHSEWYGDDAHKKRDEAIGLDKQEQHSELQGISASQGRIIGTAKVCLSAKNADENINEGDILVTGMTMPEFVPAMKKSAAVVTDEGGLTCHAAIFSRELEIPCVVGTKMATRQIKDGDLLEVNANHGVIKILKRA